MIKEIYKSLGLKGLAVVTLLFVVASGIGSIIFERFLLPSFQTWPILRNIKIIDPRAPIVITRRDEIRIEGEINTQEVISRVRGALVKVYISDEKFVVGRPAAVLSGIVAANDGLILIPAFAMQRGGNVSVVLESGEAFAGEILFVDDFSGIAFVRISARDLPVLNQASSRDKKPGEHLLSLSLEEGLGVRVGQTWLRNTGSVRPSLTDLHDLADLDSTLDLDPGVTADDLGSVIVDKDGALVGFVTSSQGQVAALSADGVQMVIQNFLSNDSAAVVWPQLRLSYLLLGPVQAEFLGFGSRNGILVRQAPAAAGPGKQDLTAGDFVYEITGREISPAQSFAEQLFSRKPREKVRLKLLRQAKEMEIEITL